MRFICLLAERLLESQEEIHSHVINCFKVWNCHCSTTSVIHEHHITFIDQWVKRNWGTQSVEIGLRALRLQHRNFQLQKGTRLMSTVPNYIPFPLLLDGFCARFHRLDVLAPERYWFSFKVSLRTSASYVLIYSTNRTWLFLLPLCPLMIPHLWSQTTRILKNIWYKDQFSFR